MSEFLFSNCSNFLISFPIFEQICGRLHGFIKAYLSDSHAFKLKLCSEISCVSITLLTQKQIQKSPNEYREHSGSVIECFDSRQRGREFIPHRRHCVVSLSKTRPDITEKLLTGTLRIKANKQTKPATSISPRNIFFLFACWVIVYACLLGLYSQFISSLNQEYTRVLNCSVISEFKMFAKVFNKTTIECLELTITAT